MLNKKLLKDIQSLSQKKFREETGLFIAEGPKIVEELMQLVPHQIQKVYAAEEWAKGRKESPFIEIVAPSELERMSALTTPNQVLAVVRQFESRKPEGSSFTLYLDTIQDPGNFGTIIRIADWFGVTDIVCSKGCADRYNPKVVQSTMASIARVNVFYDPEDNWLAQQVAPIYAASLHGDNLYQQPKAEKGILIIGNESKGIRPEWMQLASRPVTIPRRGGAESLNAAVATGIILSHLLA